MSAKKILAICFVMILTAHPVYSQTNDDFERKQRIATEQYERIQREKEAEAYRRYLINKDQADGISQKGGVVGGRTSDGEGGWIGYQWPTN